MTEIRRIFVAVDFIRQHYFGEMRLQDQREFVRQLVAMLEYVIVNDTDMLRGRAGPNYASEAEQSSSNLYRAYNSPRGQPRTLFEVSVYWVERAAHLCSYAETCRQDIR